MPTRMIRDGLLDSDKYAQLSDAARLLFVHLMLLADDFGCVNVGTTFLRRRAFFDMPSSERIAKLLLELVDTDLIRTYEVDLGRYAFIPKFRQRLDRNKLNHPKPPDTVLVGDEDAIKKFNAFNKDGLSLVNQTKPSGPKCSPKRSEEKRSKATPRAPTDVGLADGFSEFWSAYPKRRSKGEALKAWRALKPNEQLRTEILAGLQRAMNSAQWRKDDGQFIPHPATWLRAKGWEDELDQTDVSFRHGQARVGGFVP